MKPIDRPIGAAIGFALAATGVFAVAMLGLKPVLGGRQAANAAVILGVATYGLLLAWMADRRPGTAAGPLLILAAAFLGAERGGSLVVPAAAALAWLRSGICFEDRRVGRFLAEAALCPGGLLLVSALNPSGPAGSVLAVWMFLLVQALYFVVHPPAGTFADAARFADRLEKVRRRADTVLSRVDL